MTDAEFLNAAREAILAGIRDFCSRQERAQAWLAWGPILVGRFNEPGRNPVDGA